MRARFVPFPRRFAVAMTMTTLVVFGCGEKAAPQTTPATTKTTKTTKCSGLTSTSTNCISGGTSSDDDNDTSTGTGSTTYDICTQAAKNADITSTGLLSNICDNLSALKANQYTGGNTATVEPSANIANGSLTVDVKTSSLLLTSAANWWAVMQLQLKDTPTFKTKFPDGYSKKVSLEKRVVSDNVVTYDYISYRQAVDDPNLDDSAKIEYSAVTKFITLSEGVAYAQVTNMDKNKTPVSVTDMHGLILVVKKDSAHVQTYSASHQIFQDTADHLDEIKTRAVTSIKDEQVFTGLNAAHAASAN